jgi:putative nucleotidyltransferase with HDIG domain
MTRIEQLESLVRDLYEAKSDQRNDWADWLYENHVFWVADKAVEIAESHNVNPEYARAAAMLHDIADAVISRRLEDHEPKSLEIARDLLKKADFTDAEIVLIVDDAIRYHSCRGDEKPTSQEGLVLATADAMAHFQTEFFLHAFADAGLNDYAQRKEWAREKIEKDFHKKIFFESERESVRPQYETLKLLLEEA